MTDLPPLSDDDLSLALDGEADADLLARIDADPRAQARLDELRAGQARLVGSPPTPLDDEVVDGLIAAAIDAPVAPVAPVRRRGRQSRSTPWIVAAAVILLMAAGLSLVWAGRSDHQDQAGASLTAQDAATDKSENRTADSSFSDGAAADSAEAAPLSGGHGSPTTAASTATSSDRVPVLYLGSYQSGADLRTATAASLDVAWRKSGSLLQYGALADTADETGASPRRFSAQNPPTQASVDRCAEQLQVTLSMKKAPIQTGYASVGGKDVLVYEFATASAKDADRETTVVAAVGAEACDEVVFFER
jgi:hypothetical protein